MICLKRVKTIGLRMCINYVGRSNMERFILIRTLYVTTMSEDNIIDMDESEDDQDEFELEAELRGERNPYMQA